MTEWKTVQGSQTDKPAEFDTTSSPTTVYQRRNVHRVTVEYEDVTSELWEYDERTMTREEYAELRREMENAQNRADIDFIAMETGVELDA